MSFNPTVTPGMVSSFEIGSLCMESNPCSHGCKITLSDGRERSVTLHGVAIKSLIYTIASEKIPFVEEEKCHFDYCRLSGYSAEEVLTDIFK